jgi:hypothetical protein
MKHLFLLIFLVIFILIGIVFYLLVRKPEKIIVYEKNPRVLLPIRKYRNRDWWKFGGVPGMNLTYQPPTLPP